ncbi:unnamed protein product [Peronospora effusa]|uniref:PX domain-containing protein n=1 Tax=Peronospora effusa TaxID=542832 RepID=A0A3R8CRP9_9STRA|nr:hypothetical protein DD237_007423 [Peronospora effusa]CAI5701211.1 unnamed protein product [Peronospora effusa]
MSHKDLQRHPKCSALYARRLRRDSEALRPSEALAASVAYLADVTVKVNTKTLTRDASIFAITVHDTKSSSTWRHLRSYTECRAFQRRVLKMLSRGHLCFAECPWLYAYVQRVLPAEQRYRHLFRVAGQRSKPRIVENQCQALVRLFATLQRVLLNPLNQKCTVLMQQVASEVIKFITNQSDVNVQKPLNSPTYDRPLAKTFSEAYMVAPTEDTKADETSGQTSLTTTAPSLEDLNKEDFAEDDALNAAVNSVVAGQRVCCAMCALHKMRSDEQVFTCWRAENMSSHFVRLRAGAGAEWTSIVAKRSLSTQSQTQGKDAWESPAFSQRLTSPLENNRDSENQKHDGTPKDPFPGSACTPRTPMESIATFSRSSSVCELDVKKLEDWSQSSAVSSPTKDCDATSAAKMLRFSGVENIRRMPRRSLQVLNSIRNKFTTTKHDTGII